MKRNIYKTSGYFSKEEWDMWKEDFISYQIETNDMPKEEAQKIFKEDNNEFYEWVEEENRVNFECEIENLNVELESDLICLGSEGRWNGTFTGYKEIKGRNLNRIFYVFTHCDDIEVYGEKRNIYVNGIHHDGRNSAIVRMWNPNVSEERRERLLSAMYNGKENAYNNIMKHTKSLYPYVKNVYGW